MSGDLLATPRLRLSAGAREDIADGLVAPKLLDIVRFLIVEHRISVTVIKTGHPMGPVSPAGRTNDHYFHRALDIDVVDGVAIAQDPTAVGLVRLGRRLMSLGGDRRAARVMGPAEWHRALGDGDRAGFRDDSVANRIHRDHVHIGVD